MLQPPVESRFLNKKQVVDLTLPYAEREIMYEEINAYHNDGCPHLMYFISNTGR